MGDRLTPGAGVHVSRYAPERDRLECVAAHVLAVGLDAHGLPTRALVRVLAETPRNRPTGSGDLETWAEHEPTSGPVLLGNVPIVDHDWSGDTGDGPCDLCGLDPADHDRAIPVYGVSWHHPDRSCWSGHRFGR